MKKERGRVRYRSLTEKKYKEATEGFEPVVVSDKNGEKVIKYQYQGEYYYLETSSGISFNTVKRISMLISVVTILLLFLSLSIRSRLNTTAYAGGFTFFSLAPELFFLIGAVKLFSIRGELTSQQFRECRSSIYYGSLLVEVMNLCALTGIVVYYCTGGLYPQGKEWLIIAADILLVCLQPLILKAHRLENYHSRMKRTDR